MVLKMLCCSQFLIITIIFIVFQCSWVLGNQNDTKLEKIQTIPVFTPDPCYKKAVMGSEVMLHYTFRLENETGVIISSSDETGSKFSEVTFFVHL